MVRQSFRSGIPAGNPIANILVVVAGVLAIAVSVVLGFFALVAISAIILVAAAMIAVRVWWFNRKLRRQGAGNQRAERGNRPGGVIEGEYRVVTKDRDEA